MANELLRSKHVFGNVANLLASIEADKVDAFDILFLYDENGKPIIGWIDKENNPVFLEDKTGVYPVKTLPEVGEEGKIYIYNDEGYFFNGTEFVNFCKPTDVAALEAELVAKIEQALVDAKTYTDEKVADALGTAGHVYEKVKYEISHKPTGTLVNHRDKEIRVMCPTDTEWTLQQSGEGADANKYYIGFKAYAPEDAVSFKEDLAEIIVDETMYYFEGNDFAGVDEYGRKYSVVWLPVAVNAEGTWTYYGANSSKEKYIGWYYSVEWYNADGVVIESDCIRVNLSNEECHSAIEPFYLNNVNAAAIETAKAYTDEQIANAVTIIEI